MMFRSNVKPMSCRVAYVVVLTCFMMSIVSYLTFERNSWSRMIKSCRYDQNLGVNVGVRGALWSMGSNGTRDVFNTAEDDLKNVGPSNSMANQSSKKCSRTIDGKCPFQHIGFLKVHKCASSTMLNIMYRFGLKRNLNFVLPLYSNYLNLNPKYNVVTVVPPPLHTKYDIICNHVYGFNQSQFAKLLPSDTKFIAIVRDPFDRLLSAFNYYRNIIKMPMLMSIKGNDTFQTYVDNVVKLESTWGYKSYTNNKMVRDFGYPWYNYKNIKKFVKYLNEIDKTFDLVMVMELFEESLVLMKRMLKWNMEDIIFITKNAHKQTEPKMSGQSDKLRPYLALDQLLYDHFKNKLLKRIDEEGSGFSEEVSQLKDISIKVKSFCGSSASHANSNSVLIEASKWNDSFNVSAPYCVLLNLKEKAFLKIMREKQIERIWKYGADVRGLI